MPARERGGRADPGKLTRLLLLLEAEATALFRRKDLAGRFSNPLFAALCAAWSDWRRGIPPGREWAGRGAQNALLLRAFGHLDTAAATAQAEARAAGPPESRAAFEARVLSNGGSHRLI